MSEDVRILCVDDEKNVLRALERLFMDDDYEIITANSGKEGIEILQKSANIQLIISDYRMPGMNGVDFLKEVRKMRPETVRIVLSGYADTASIVEAINEGQIYKFIAKPWNDDELRIAIAKALDHYFAIQNNIRLTKELEDRNRELREINNNLEQIIEKRTADLVMRNKILTASQNILDALPVGVIGVDPEGLVVQCNRKGMKYLGIEDSSIIGANREDSLPCNVNRIVDEIFMKGDFSEMIGNNGLKIHIRGVHMKYPNGQEGAIIVMDGGGDETCQ